MNHDSAIQIRVSSGWIRCKSLSFYVESFNIGFFPLLSLPWNFPSCVPCLLILGYPAQSTVWSRLLWALLPSFHTLPTDTRALLMKALIIIHRLVPSKLLTTCSVNTKFLTIGPEALHSLTCTHISGFFPPHHTSFTSNSIQTRVFTSPWIKSFFWCLFFVHWERISMPVHWVTSYPSLKVKAISCPLLEISWFTLVGS